MLSINCQSDLELFVSLKEQLLWIPFIAVNIRASRQLSSVTRQRWKQTNFTVRLFSHCSVSLRAWCRISLALEIACEGQEENHNSKEEAEQWLGSHVCVILMKS